MGGSKSKNSSENIEKASNKLDSTDDSIVKDKQEQITEDNNNLNSNDSDSNTINQASDTETNYNINLFFLSSNSSLGDNKDRTEINEANQEAIRDAEDLLKDLNDDTDNHKKTNKSRKDNLYTSTSLWLQHVDTTDKYPDTKSITEEDVLTYYDNLEDAGKKSELGKEETESNSDEWVSSYQRNEVMDSKVLCDPVNKVEEDPYEELMRKSPEKTNVQDNKIHYGRDELALLSAIEKDYG